MNDSYDIAKKILELYSANVNKSSGEIMKNSLTIPLYFQYDDVLYEVDSADFDERFGIVLNMTPPN